MSAQQNLVPNGSFEDTIGCPDNYDQLYKAISWYKPTLGSSDYYNNCNSATNFISVPQNAAGYQLAKEGQAYAGFSIGFDTVNIAFNNYREYLQIKLSSTLKLSKKYIVSFYISRADSFFVGVKNIGAYFSSNPISCNCNSTLLYNPQITSNSYIIDNTSWVLIQGEFTSNGTEEYLTIGYFNNNNSLDTVVLSSKSDNYAYYFIDQVSVTEAEIPITLEIPNIFTPNFDGVNDIFTFNSKGINIEELAIINRWGLKVFESNNHFSWDGRTTSGETCSSGTYYYIIQTETETYKGFLELIR